MKSGPESELLDRYLDRTRKTGKAIGVTGLEMREFAESRAPSTSGRCSDEAEQLLTAAGRDCHVIALDERGKDIDSAGFARIIGDRLADRTARMAFLIGGPDGHGPKIAETASSVIRFGRATWPHRLIRIMLAEQLYRATTILSGHPYHRE